MMICPKKDISGSSFFPTTATKVHKKIDKVKY